MISRLRIIWNKKFEKLYQQFLLRDNKMALGWKKKFPKGVFSQMFSEKNFDYVSIKIVNTDIATPVQINNLFKFFVPDKPQPENHERHEHTSFCTCHIDAIKKTYETN